MPAKDTVPVAARIPKETADEIEVIVKASGIKRSTILAGLIKGGLSALRDTRKSGTDDVESFDMLEDEPERETT